MSFRRTFSPLGIAFSAACLFVPLASGAPAYPDSVDPAQETRWWGYDPTSPSVPFPYVYEPTTSWVYEEIEREIALGNLSHLHFLSRPLPRSLIAARVAEALNAGRRSTGLLRLAREMAWEGRMMGLGFSFQDSRPMVTIGPKESQLKLNGVLGAGGTFARDAAPDFNEKTFASIRGLYWHPSGFSMSGEYMVTQIQDATRFGDPVFKDSEIQFWVPRASIAWHGGSFEAWLGKEDFRWGPGRSGGLLLGGGNEPVTHLGARVHAGTFATLSAVHGWLSEAHGQYVAYHRVELNLGKGLHLGIGEGVRYDGPSPDPLYILNIIPYAVVERIQTAEGDVVDADRDSLVRSNYIAAVDLYWQPGPGWAFYGEFMLDDVKDPSEKTPTRLAYQAGAKHVRSGTRTLTLQAEYTRVYNYTYMAHYNRNFVHRGTVLGFPLGADVADLRFWTDVEMDVDWSLGLNLHYTKIGEGNGGGAWCPPELETDNPFGTNCQTYGDASGRDFAGIVEEAAGVAGSVVFAPRDNLRFEMEGGVDFVTHADHVEGQDRTRPLGTARVTWRW